MFWHCDRRNGEWFQLSAERERWFAICFGCMNEYELLPNGTIQLVCEAGLEEI